MTGIIGHPARLDVAALLEECDLEGVRRSGPGGQHRNKVETGVVLRHRATGLRVEASERRSREANRRTAIRRLRVRLALGVRMPGTTVSELWRERCPRGRIVVGHRHPDFPSLLAEALDRVRARDGELPTAADELGCTSSQLVRFLKVEPAALVLVNEWRRERGLTPLK